MEAVRAVSENRAFRKSLKNVPNLKLKGDTFDAAHLSQFIVEENVGAHMSF